MESVLLIWLSCAAISLVFDIVWWRRRYDVTVGDMCFFIFMSILGGPINLFVSVIYLMTFEREWTDKVIFRGRE